MIPNTFIHTVCDKLFVSVSVLIYSMCTSFYQLHELVVWGYYYYYGALLYYYFGVSMELHKYSCCFFSSPPDFYHFARLDLHSYPHAYININSNI